MCTILFAYKVHPVYDLIVAANRDEMYSRPTAPVNYWEDHPNVLAGRDLEKMGTWMGITTSGRFSAITNYRDPNELQEGKASRGSIVSDLLVDEGDPKQKLELLREKRDLFPSFNVLAGNVEQMYYYSNRSKGVEVVAPGIHGLSNHLLNTPWPKIIVGKQRLQEIITENISGNLLMKNLFSLLQNKEQFPDNMLPKTGVSVELERCLSSLYIKGGVYGTKSSTIILMNSKEIQFVERIFEENKRSERSYTLAISV